MRSLRRNTAVRGFSLIEVLVALVVVSVGLLGIAKMQAIAYSSTGVASKRSLAAIEAASLASAMHANRAYWSVSGVTPVSTTITGASVSASTDPALLAVTDCTLAGAGPSGCSPSALAAYDLNGVNGWAPTLKQLLGTSDQAAITCATPVAPLPVTCTVTISWSENQVALNTQEAAAANAGPAALQLPSYTLYIEP